MARGPKKRKTIGLEGPNVIDFFKKMARKANPDLPIEEDNEDTRKNNITEPQAKSEFQYRWLKIWLWMRYDKENDAIFCTSCEDFAISGNSPFAQGGSRNFKTSSFNEHAASKTHMTAEIKRSNAAKTKKPIVVAVQNAHSSIDGAVLNLFRAAYTVAARSWSFIDYEHLIDLVDLMGCSAITKSLYHNDHACQEIICCIGESLYSSLIGKIKTSPFFGLQVDESTDVATQQHLVLCISYLEYGCEPKHNFLSMIRVKKADAGSLYDALVNHLTQVGFDMSKLVGFGSDGASTMTGRRTGVAARLKTSYPYMTAIHCIAHRANLAVQDVAKQSNMEWVEEIETLVNAIAAHFSRSSQRLEKLQGLLEEYACAILRLHVIQKTRWLSRHDAISRLCEDLSAVLKYVEIEALDIFKKLPISE